MYNYITGKYPLLAILLLMLTAFDFPPAGKASPAKTRSFALIELFTSEGCSSCPPADKLLAELIEPGVYALELHVDYWDRLGWKDPYSKASFSERQRQYADRFNLSSIYTPQAIINGKFEFVGSDKGRLQNSIKEELSHPVPDNQLTLNLTTSGNQFFISFKLNIPATKNDMINLAVIQLHATTNVTRGENQGRELQHVNIVRDLKIFNIPSGNYEFTTPKELTTKDFQVIAFIQNKDNLHVSYACEAVAK